MRIIKLLFVLFFLLQCQLGIAIENFSAMVEGSSQSFIVRIPHGGVVSPEVATSIAKSKVLRIAMLAAANALAEQSSMQFLNENNGGVNFSSFNIDGLARKICDFSPPECNIDSEKVVCLTRATWSAHTTVSQEIAANLKQVPLLERYVALVHCNESLLQQYDSLVQDVELSPDAKEMDSRKAQLVAVATELEGLMEYEHLLKEYVGKWENPKKILPILEGLLNKKPVSPLIFVALAEGYIQLKEPAKALEFVDQAIKRLPDVAYFHDIKGTVFLLQNLPVLAADSYSKAISLATSEAFYKTHRGYALYLLRKEDAMCKDFYQACVEGDCEALSWSRKENLCKK